MVCTSFSHKFGFGGGPDTVRRIFTLIGLSFTNVSVSYMDSSGLSSGCYKNG